MKYILKNPLFILCLMVIVIIGFFLGHNISDDFIGLYISKLMLIPIRYLLLVVVVSIDFLVFDHQSKTGIVLRKKTLLESLLSMVKCEIIILFVLFSFLHFPILILNTNNYFINLSLINKILTNCIAVSLFLNAIIKIIDLKLKNRALSCGILLSIFCIFDFLLEHFNWFSFENVIFDFSYIFVLPFKFSNYLIVISILLVTTIVLIAIYIYFGIKTDCFLRIDYDKEY